MNKSIYILHDYLERFETKVPANPYKSGFDKEQLITALQDYGYITYLLNFADVFNEKISFENCFIIYTSIEDSGLHYKDFMEDVLLGIEARGGILIPRFELFRAHHNKVFMEILRKNTFSNILNNINSKCFGSLEELLKSDLKDFSYPIVIKSAFGAGSKYVKLATSYLKLIKYAKKLSNSKEWQNYFLDIAVMLKRKENYKREKIYRKKFIIQEYIPDLKNDWKILIYGKKYYILKRFVRRSDFRASGSGNFIGSNTKDFSLPEGLLDFSKKIYETLNVPNLSLDVVYDDNKFYVLEFQAISFGTFTQTSSEFYYIYENETWSTVNMKIPLEKLYAESVDLFIRKNYGK